MHSSSYNPTGKAHRVDGGYRISGRWSFSSGCDQCEGVNLGAILRSAEATEYRSFLLHAEQYVIEDNWYVAGLRELADSSDAEQAASRLRQDVMGICVDR